MRPLETLLQYIDVGSIFERSPEYSVKFVIPYTISNDEFCRAAQVVLNAEVFRDESEVAFARVGGVYFDQGGIIGEGRVLEGCYRVKIPDSNNDAVWSVASIKLELLFGDHAFLSEWYHRPMFPLESIAYLYLPQMMLDRAQYPFKGAMLEADFSEEVKEHIREGDLYSSIGEYFGFSSSEDYMYDSRALTGHEAELWYNVVSKEPLKSAFLATRVTDSTMQYAQKMIEIFDTLPRLGWERDITRWVSDSSHLKGGYRQFKRDIYDSPETADQTKWSYTLSVIVASRLSDTPGVVKVYISGDNRASGIFTTPLTIEVDLASRGLEYFLFALESFTRILRHINRQCKFFYGYRSSKFRTDGKRFYLFDFSESIYDDGDVDVSQERENQLAKELQSEYGLDIFSFASEHYIALDTLCFHRASQHHPDSEVKEYCAREVRRMVTHLSAVSR